MRDSVTIGSEPTYYSGLDDVSGKTEEEKVEWFKGRFSKIVIGPLEEVKIVGVENQNIWDLNLGVVTIICCAIEALSSFYVLDSNTSDKAKFTVFVEKFMDPIYRETSSCLKQKYSEILYEKFRCGLAHGMSIEGHEIASRPEEYLSDDNGYVSIDLWGLLDDLKNAFSVYIDAIYADKEAMAAFLTRFEAIFEEPYGAPEA